MGVYEKLLMEIEDSVVIDDTANLPDDISGYYVETSSDNLILLNKNIESTKARTCTLAEEIGHYHTSFGNITDQSKVESRKQERIARGWAYDKLIGIVGLVNAYKYGCKNRYEIAEYLNVSEKFLEDAIVYYSEKYSPFYEIDNYIVYFNPLSVIETWD